MIWQRWMKSRLVVSALPGSNTSQAISPALSCDRLRVYLLGSVCPIRRVSASRGGRGNAKAANRSRIVFIGGHLYFFAVIRPGVLTGMLHNWPPDVTYRVFRSEPPNAQLVVSSFSNATNSSNLPTGESM